MGVPSRNMKWVISVIGIFAAVALMDALWDRDSVPPQTPTGSSEASASTGEDAADQTPVIARTPVIQKQAIVNSEQSVNAHFHMTGVFAETSQGRTNAAGSHEHANSRNGMAGPMQGMDLRIVYHALDDPNQALEVFESARPEIETIISALAKNYKGAEHHFFLDAIEFRLRHELDELITEPSIRVEGVIWVNKPQARRGRSSRLARALKQLEHHHVSVHKFLTKHGRLPAADEVPFESAVLDPWGSRYFLRRLPGYNTFDVISAGPDRTLNSPDDFGWLHRRAQDRRLHHGRVERARQQASVLALALDKHMKAHGQAAILQELAFKDGPLPKRPFSPVELTDPWGQSYEVRWISHLYSRVVSLGPDARELTDDDIGSRWARVSEQQSPPQDLLWFPQELKVEFAAIDSREGSARLRLAMHAKEKGRGFGVERVARLKQELEARVRTVLSSHRAADLRSAGPLTHITNEIRSGMIEVLFPEGEGRVGEIEWLRLDP